jgi:UDP:flavonoid glycosyltransferase YjiC (YdhE family)
MRITILTAGTRGDLQPYLGLGVGLRRAGHHVFLPAPEEFRDLVTGAGLEFEPVSLYGGLNADGPQGALQSPEIQNLARKAHRPLSLLSDLGEAIPKVRRSFSDMLDAYWRSSENADALLASFWVLGLDCAERRGIKYIFASHQPMSPTRAFPFSIMAPRGGRLNSPLNRLTYYPMHLGVWSMLRPVLNTWRREMGLAPHTARSYWRRIQAQPAVYAVSPSILPVPTDWPSNHHVTGYWFLDEPTGFQPPADLVRFLEGGPPPICIGFGSMALNDPARITGVVLEALALSGQRAVLISSWSGLDDLALPETVYRLDGISHSWLFPKVAAVVHHGGRGTAAAAFRAGVPAVVVPFMFDQPFWAKRVEELGVGVRFSSFSKVTAQRLAAALDKVTSDTDMRRRAVALGERIRAEDGVGQAVALIQKHLGQ